MEDEIKRLRSQVKALQEENRYLKRLLEEAGILYVRQPEAAPVEITRQLARRFYSYFWGRMDVYSKRSVNKTTGKTQYYPQCENLWKDGRCPKKAGKKVRCKDCDNRKWKALEAEQIIAHLRGEKPDGSDVIGVYPLFPDGSCRFLVFDFDNHEKGAEALDFGNTDNRWMEEVDALRQAPIPFPVWWSVPVPAGAGICGFSLRRQWMLCWFAGLEWRCWKRGRRR